MTSSGTQILEFGGERIVYAVERTARRKTVAISVGYDGVRVLAPFDVNDTDITELVRKKGPWVLKKQALYQELGGNPPLREFISGETYHYLGRPYRLKVIPDINTLVTRITARGALLIAPAPSDVDPAIRRSSVRSGLRLWYRDKAKLHFPKRAKVMANLLGIPTPIIQIVDQSKRWGSCDAHGRIRLNWRLVMAPMALVDYVIAHETCHILEHNHSHRFWRSLETIMPDYELRVRQLDRNGHMYTW